MACRPGADGFYLPVVTGQPTAGGLFVWHHLDAHRWLIFEPQGITQSSGASGWHLMDGAIGVGYSHERKGAGWADGFSQKLGSGWLDSDYRFGVGGWVAVAGR